MMNISMKVRRKTKPFANIFIHHQEQGCNFFKFLGSIRGCPARLLICGLFLVLVSGSPVVLFPVNCLAVLFGA